MSIEKENFVKTNEMYGSGIAVEEYKGEYSLQNAKENPQGDIWPEWCFPQRRLDGENVPSQKAVPWKLSLGNKQQAVQRVEQLLVILEKLIR